MATQSGLLAGFSRTWPRTWSSTTMRSPTTGTSTPNSRARHRRARCRGESSPTVSPQGGPFRGWETILFRYDQTFRDAIERHLDKIRAAKGRPGAAGKTFDATLLDMHWSFVAPTNPPALCVDTRTSREFPEGKTVILSGQNVWPHLR